ncbi:MAG: HAD family hydrolase [Pirellula sp.]
MPVPFHRKLFLNTLCLAVACLWIQPARAQLDRPAVDAAETLSSWKDCATKRALIAYVQRVCDPKSSDFVPQPERIAVFDNDGTLWPENPVPFQVAYAFDIVDKRAANDPEFAKQPMVQAVLKRDIPTLLAGERHEGLLQVIAMTHAGMSVEEFHKSVSDWMAQAKHPKFNKRYDQLTYQPMQEVLAHLRANGFKTYIVSGGGADFMRVWSERVYGIPPEQVIGSSAKTKFELREGKPVLIKTLDQVFVDDKAGKPVGIHQAIGRRPIVCFGNSDGDHAMLQYTTIGNPRPSFGAIVHHTDPDREYAYDSAPKSSGKLVEALADAPNQGWYVIDMKEDWSKVFAE